MILSDGREVIFYSYFLIFVGAAAFSSVTFRLIIVEAIFNNNCASSFSRKDPHGFFAFPVTEAIAPGYSTFIKHPMDFSTMKDKIINNEYNTVTEFKVSIQFYNTVMCADLFLKLSLTPP